MPWWKPDYYTDEQIYTYDEELEKYLRRNGIVFEEDEEDEEVNINQIEESVDPALIFSHIHNELVEYVDRLGLDLLEHSSFGRLMEWYGIENEYEEVEEEE